MDKYSPNDIEVKWQEKWEKAKLYEAADPPSPKSKKPKKYILIEFPYPSGERLHVGHGRSYTSLDALSRMYRMQNFNVLYPIGWDAFGLPAENYAIKTGINPAITTSENIKNAKNQAKRWGLSFDWSREVNTTDPKYYKWTQWLFLQMLKNNLAYQAEVAVNWCPFCKTNLADEEVLSDGRHERCGNLTEKRLQKQWILKITAYADRLLEDLKTVDYLPKIKKQQENWIGKSEGVELEFPIFNSQKSSAYSKFSIKIFTTAIDTIFGATFMVLSPEYAKNLLDLVSQEKKEEVSNYIINSLNKSEQERKTEVKNKTGVDTGIKAINPFTNSQLPVYVADYVLMEYGTGAIMAVPGHDERDFDFAKKYGLSIVYVVKPNDPQIKVENNEFWSYEEIKTKYANQCVLVNSDSYNGLTSIEAKERMISEIEKKGIGHKIIHYHLRDWVFSRQHYWGEPIPVVHCPKDGIVPIPEDQLPVELPYIENYKPIGTGESPLAAVTDWVNTTCPKCGGLAKRETDTMPNWAGSNWYFVGYVIAKQLENYYKKNNKGNIFSDDKKILDYWLPVDLYNGGMEHTTLHLLYSRFVYKFMYDLGIVPNPEPYKRRHSHGVVLGPDGQKMSKSKGNVINPDDVIKAYGADTFRLYEMFMGPFEDMIAWSDDGVAGCYRFLRRVWQLSLTKVADHKTPEEVNLALNKTVKKVSEDLEAMKFNTAVASMMEFINVWARPGYFVNKKDAKVFLQILTPFAPHITEELWSKLGNKFSIHQTKWPVVGKTKVSGKEKAMMIVEINGKVRDKVEVEAKKSLVKSEVEKLVKDNEKIKKYLEGQKIKQVIFVPGKLINFVI